MIPTTSSPWWITWPRTAIGWTGGRHGPGHNLFTYHKDPDGNVIELFTQIDRMTDESKGYWEPQPWHETFPMYPKT